MRLTALSLVLVACAGSSVTNDGGDGAGGGQGGGRAVTGFDCRSAAGACTESQVGVSSAGSCGDDGVCRCQPGYVRNPLTETCWPVMSLCHGPDAGFFTTEGVVAAAFGKCGGVDCPTGSDCVFDAGPSCVPAPAGRCVGPLSCGLLECRDGCRCADEAQGRCSCSAPTACEVGSDQTCNDVATMSSFAGHCVDLPSSPNRCICNPGFAPNPSTGKCRPADAGM